MDKEYQSHQIQNFLKGKYRKEIDVFCIYQWIERCQFHGWWEVGLELGSFIPPNSLDTHYHKRLDYLLSECRHNVNVTNIQISPIVESTILRTHLPEKLPVFESSWSETLRQIYCVLYFMGREGQDFPNAVRSCMKTLNVKDYQTVCDKCARRFAGTVDNFKKWFSSGGIVRRLNVKFQLKPQDNRIFEELLAK
jgi:hypothetical protein